MNYPFINLQAVSIWMTMDMVNYILLVDYRDSNLLFNSFKKNKSNEFLKSLIDAVQKLIRTSPFLGYKIHCNTGDHFICYSSHNDLSGAKIKIVKEVCAIEVHSNRELYDSLTRREKQLLYLIAAGNTQTIICKKLDLKLQTCKFHRKNLYRKMNFYSKDDLVIWADKYLRIFYKQVV